MKTRSETPGLARSRAVLAAIALFGAAAACTIADDGGGSASSGGESAAGPPGSSSASGAPGGSGSSDSPEPSGTSGAAAHDAAYDGGTLGDASDADADALADAEPSSCDAGLVRCGGSCVDIQTDNANCGGCGLGCASCSAGECLETLFDGGGMALGLAVDDDRVYWVDFDHFDVTSALHDGGSVATLATGQVYPKDIAVDGAHVYWVTAGAGIPYGTVMRASLDGGSPTALVTDLPAPQRLRLAPNQHLYWVNGYPLGGPAAQGVATDGGAPVTVGTADGGAGPIAANAAGVFWVDGDTASLWSSPFSGTPTSIASATNLSELAVTATHAYWTEGGENRIMSLELGSGPPRVLATAQTWGPVGITVDDAAVYWIENGGAIVKASLTDGTVRTLVTGLTGGSQYIAVHGNSVYWTSGGSVYRLTPK